MNKEQKTQNLLSEELLEPLAAILCRLCSHISERGAEKLQEMLPDFESQSKEATGKLLGALPDFDAQSKRTDYKLDSLEKRIDTLTANNELLENANQMNRLLSPQFYDERVVMPMARNLFPIMDLIMVAKGKLAEDTSKYQLALQYLSALQVQLEQFLAGYGIESFSHKTKNLDPKVMKPLKTTPTDDCNLEGLVEKTLQCGFKIEERVLRLESVSLYKYQG